MAIVLNPFTGQLDVTGSGGADSRVDDLVELTGVPEGSTDLGVAAGDVVSDNATIKQAIDELDVNATDINQAVADLVTLSGVPANSTDLGTFSGGIIPDNSDNKEAIQALETAIEAIPDPMTYKGTWNATTNTPTLADGIGHNGDVYYVTVAGSQFTPTVSFEVGDKVVYNGATAKYEKWDMTDAVASVFGRIGIVAAEDGDYTASQVTNVPVGAITSTNVQDAIDELQTNIEGISLQTAYNQSLLDPEIILTAELGAITLQQGSGDDSDRILEFLNGTSDVVGYIDGNGQLELTSDIITHSDITADGNITGANLSGTNTGDQVIGSPGDIVETSFSAANNQSSAANVTGFAFSNAVVRSFTALVSVEIDATSDLYEQFTLNGIQKGASWNMSQESVGDSSGIVFSITSAGQIQYTSTNISGFVTNLIKFRAIVTSF